MIIQIDSREHKWELARIQRQLEKLGVKTIISKLYVGDYQSWDNPRLVVDRKKNLQELVGNVTQQHERFRAELVRAKDADIRLVILIEDDEIESLEDVYFWENPRLKTSPKATTGRSLYRSMLTLQTKYGVRFEFCGKQDTGRRIKEILDEQG